MEALMTRKKPKRSGPGLFKYFERLKREKKVRTEDVASRLDLSYTTVNNWKYGRCKPRRVDVIALEATYGIPVEGVA